MAKKQPDGSVPGISRRAFFKNSTAGALSAGLLPTVRGEGAPDVEIHGPGEVQISLNINGKTQQLRVEPRVTLLDALRDKLDLTGAKKVCDRGSCGACTVLVDGRPAYSCSILAISAQGREIVTVESLSTQDKLHPLQEAFVHNDAQQCGFCTPGFVLAAKALLDGNPSPTDEEITKGLGGNLCRCGTYVGVRAAVMQTAGKGVTSD